ncbi:TPA: deoxynucleoside kinase [Candidatus Woesearchaeota archaeon]|nr:deoxynucleoside kinase [Candidatus Woesearchaeota archaeon]
MENLRIGIVGNIGVGKSTLVEAATRPPLSDLLLSCLPSRTDEDKVHAFPEEFNPVVLDAFYEDPIENAFMAQIEFFNGRLDRQKRIENARGIVLEDRILHEDYHIFGLAQKILSNMTEAEFQAYKRTYDMMTERVSEPDLIVYLKADVPTLQKRIRERGRESESTIPEQYLRTLNELYESFITRHVSCPVLTIDADKEYNGDLYIYLAETVKKIVDRIKTLDLRVTTPGLSDWVTLPQTEATIRAIDAEKRLEDYLQRNPRLITIGGNVGLGKTTLAAIMERSLKIRGLYEEPEKNPLLERFLRDKKTHCYDLQMHFLQMRAEHRLIGKSGDGSYVKDRSLPEDLLVFCYQFNRDGILTDRELDSLVAAFKSRNLQLPPSDIMLVLQGSPSLAWQRIQQRGREMEIEGGWSLADIQKLNRWYRSFPEDVRRYGFHDGPLLELDVERLDLTNRIHVGYIFEKVYDALKKR